MNAIIKYGVPGICGTIIKYGVPGICSYKIYRYLPISGIIGDTSHMNNWGHFPYYFPLLFN